MTREGHAALCSFTLGSSVDGIGCACSSDHREHHHRRLKCLHRVRQSGRQIDAVSYTHLDVYKRQVVRAFEDDDIIHVNGHVDPDDDIDTINTELILADLQTIDNALPKLEKDLRGKKIEKSYMDAVLKAKEILESGRTIDQAAQAGEIKKEEVYDLSLIHIPMARISRSTPRTR